MHLVMRPSDSKQNYVDRVRLPDASSSYIFGGPGRGSGWRQRSLSNIDLTSQTRHSFTKQSRDYSSGLYDLYSRIESRKDYQNIYKFGDHSASTKHSESIYDQVRSDAPIGPDSCSLRRTRSLAVIREETYNDLQITGIRTRRSQLIPRAKLVNRSFFKNRKQRLREEDSGSGVDTQTSETRESDDYYANLKKLETSDKLVVDQPWANDKSDLDSLDSDYFKHSLHQSPVNFEGEKLPKLYIQEIHVHDTKTEVCSIDETRVVSSSNKSEDFNEAKDVQVKLNNEDSDSTYDNCKVTYNTNTLTLTRVKVGNFDDDDADRRSKFKEDGKSVVSYDSIYLSSEDSNDRTVVQESVEDPLPDVSVNKAGEFYNEPDEDQPSLDSLYSQISKSKPKIISLEPKANLTSFSDTSTRGTLERLTFISTTPQTQKKDYSQVEGKRFSTEPFVGTLVDNQYCSLPDVSIGLSLHASERIDEKLRLSCKVVGGGTSSTDSIHDSISRFGKAHKRLRQRESVESEETKSISIEEPLKEAEVIEVAPLNKPIEEAAPTKPIEEATSNKPIKVAPPNKPIDEAPPIKAIKAPSIKSNEVTPIKPIENNNDNGEKPSRERDHLPIAINLKKKKIIVDELAARNQKTSRDAHNQSFKLEANKTTKFTDIKIIVTDTQNNIIEHEELDNEVEEVKYPEKKLIEKPKRKEEPSNQRHSSTSQVTITVKDDNSTKSIKTETKDKAPCPQPLGSKVIQSKKPPLKKSAPVEQKDLRSEFKANLTDTLRKRIAESRNIFNARPIRISSEEHIEKLNDTYEINSSLTYKVKFKEQTKMSRPQILTVVDSKRNVCSVAPRQANDLHDEKLKCTKNSIPPTVLQPEVKQEFKEKVDSVRCYWSKLIEENGHCGVDEVDHDENQIRNESVRNYIASMEKQNQENTFENTNRNSKVELRDNEDFTSFSPSVEIIELDGQKHAAVVKSQSGDTQDFDHVRYKVMKSDTFQKNILAHNRKEAQFDGLLQYLHNYSFQELLASNNVVIIEPIRTKIEKPSAKSNEPQTVHCKITGGAGRQSDSNKSAIKRHFFYHPIRVNKELLDEELPHPDTVRKARILFEETLRLRNHQKHDDSTTGNGGRSTEKLRRKALRYLTIDTSFGNAPKKWDSSSVSSGISSGELSSPCECNDHDDNKEVYSSEENIYGYDMCESYYVSQDVLEKIRESGSSITYFGGRVVDKNSSEVSPMTKAIMKEIRGQSRVCGVCQPHDCPHQSKIFPKNQDQENVGLKFKLVKSNSCSSRLELAGTGIDEQQLRNTKQHISDIENRSKPPPPLDAEDSVRSMVNRLETGAINQKEVPRIIESKCIEKVAVDPSKRIETEQLIDTSSVSINNQMIDEQQSRLGPVDILRQVTVNNHINFTPPVVVAGDSVKSTINTINTTTSMAQAQRNQTKHPNNIHTPETLRTNKVPRNRNVDLAFAMNRTANEKSDEMKIVSTNEVLLEPDGNQQQVNKTNFRNAKNLLNETGDNGTMTIQVCSSKREIDVRSANNTNEGPEQQEQSTQNNSPSSRQQQPVKWNTLSQFDEKNYVANDAKLKQKPKYDEIEFEEFQVYDPKNANNECYDSLNDK